ncbi:hypothetical protein M407DRAFT_71806 [Tulasnella calospora MUT 4182]|uniref:Uncharacterized protein n=1 Tax=Tulasnella calospora MUT 4182 TaxID=1051891 RepID=A0A0C3QLH1_9AGAM|nr:hypothetical protein M407DRAFT_71806 [Tulasnella calospora MUT 4182]
MEGYLTTQVRWRTWNSELPLHGIPSADHPLHVRTPPHTPSCPQFAPIWRPSPNIVELGQFFAQDAAAGTAMTDTLAALPPSQKATYTKLQASVRSAYHTWTSLRRLQEFRAFLASTTPGASLTPPARSDPHSPLARKERLERFTRFINAFCQPGTPGTHPFFEGLYGLLRLQSLGENLGGAGSVRIEWEVDDSVFLESGGKEFTTEAIDNLKGVSVRMPAAEKSV